MQPHKFQINKKTDTGEYLQISEQKSHYYI